VANGTGRKPAARGSGARSKRRMRIIAVVACAALLVMAAALVVMYLNQAYCFLC